MTPSNLKTRSTPRVLGKRVSAILIIAVAAIVAGTFLARGSETYLRQGIARELSSATGMEAWVGGLHLSTENGTIEDVRLRGGGREIRIGALEVDADLEALFAGQTACIEHARVDRVEVVLGPRLDLERGHRVDASPERPRSKAQAMEGALREITAQLRRFIAPGGRVDIEEVVVLVGEGGIAPSPILRARGTRLERQQDDFLVEARAEIGDAGKGRGTFRFGSTRPTGRVEVEDARLSALVAFLPELPWYRPDRTHIHGSVELELPEDTSSAIRLRGNVTVTDAGLYAPVIADEPVVVDLALSGGAVLDDGTLTVDSGAVRVGRGSFAMSGRLSWNEEHLLDLEAEMPRQECNDAMSIVPHAVLGELSRFKWSGEFGGTVRLRFDTKNPDSTVADVRLDNDCRFEQAPAVADTSRFKRVFIHEVTDDAGETHTFETGPGSREWVSISEVSPFLVHAVLAHEDATFFQHHGFAPFAIETALKRNVAQGRMAYGASTISMQLAKNLFLTRDKTLARKTKEVFLTWWLESSLTKSEILELYLNVIEYGPQIYGLRSASRAYFGRDPDALTPGESSFLASLLPSPTTYFRQFRSGELSRGTKQQMAFLLRHMHARNRIDEQALRYGLWEIDQIGSGAELGLASPLSANVGSAALLPFSAPPRPQTPRLWWRRSDSLR